MIFRWMANSVIWLHVAFVLFVGFGALLVFRWPKAAYFHVPTVFWGALIEFTGWVCPLTPLENWLRTAGGQSAYRGAFVDRYLMPILYPDGLTHETQITIGVALFGVNGLLYLLLMRRRHRSRH
jgi:hypothetical protein